MRLGRSVISKIAGIAATKMKKTKRKKANTKHGLIQRSTALLSILLAISGFVYVNDARAVDVFWDNGDPSDQLWSSPLNWSGDLVPTSEDQVFSKVNGIGPIVTSSAVCQTLREIRNGGTVTIEPGGDLTSGEIRMYNGTITINGGSILSNPGVRANYAGAAADCTLNINSGTFKTSGSGHFYRSNTSGGEFYVNLKGGTLDTVRYGNTNPAFDTPITDIEYGTLKVSSSYWNRVLTAISEGRLTAYDGTGTLIADTKTRTFTAINVPDTRVWDTEKLDAGYEDCHDMDNDNNPLIGVVEKYQDRCVISQDYARSGSNSLKSTLYPTDDIPGLLIRSECNMHHLDFARTNPVVERGVRKFYGFSILAHPLVHNLLPTQSIYILIFCIILNCSI